MEQRNEALSLLFKFGLGWLSKSAGLVNISPFSLSFFLTDPLRHGALFSRLNIVMQMGPDGIVVRVERPARDHEAILMIIFQDYFS